MSRITGSDAKKLMEAYTSIYAPQEEVELTEEQVQEDFENWVNSLVEEGHDLSEYTWEDMYEEYLNELQQLNPQQLRSLGTAATKSGLERTFAAGGGRAALMKPGATFQSVFAQGSKNLRTQQKPSPAPVTRTPAATTQRPAAPAAARPAAPVARTATTSNAPAPSRTSYAGATGVKPVGTPLPTNAVQPVAGAPAQPMSRMAQQTAELRKMRQASQQRQIAQGGTPATPLVQSFDPFDIVMGHLIDEGYADTEVAALQIMANMSEEWRQSIVEGSAAISANVPAGRTIKITAGGTEPPGDRMLRQAGQAISGLLGNKAKVQSTTVQPRKPLQSTQR